LLQDAAVVLVVYMAMSMHSIPFKGSSALCLGNNIHQNVAVNRGGREYGPQRKDTGEAKEW
jgi:hypothetical protein